MITDGDTLLDVKQNIERAFCFLTGVAIFLAATSPAIGADFFPSALCVLKEGTNHRPGVQLQSSLQRTCGLDDAPTAKSAAR